MSVGIAIAITIYLKLVLANVSLAQRRQIIQDDGDVLVRIYRRRCEGEN